MKTKYDVGDVIPIGFEIQSITIGKYATTYSIASINAFNGSRITLNMVCEAEIDKEVNNENQI